VTPAEQKVKIRSLMRSLAARARSTVGCIFIPGKADPWHGYDSSAARRDQIEAAKGIEGYIRAFELANHLKPTIPPDEEAPR